MSRLNHTECKDWERVEFRKAGKIYTGYFSNMRVDKTTLPAGYYFYELRDEDSNGEVCEVAKGILVNFYGTLLTTEPITGVEENGYCFTSPEEFNFIEYVGNLPIDKTAQTC